MRKLPGCLEVFWKIKSRLIERKCPARSRALFEFGGPGRNRTTDTRIFSPLLYRLSYQAKKDCLLYVNCLTSAQFTDCKLILSVIVLKTTYLPYSNLPKSSLRTRSTPHVVKNAAKRLVCVSDVSKRLFMRGIYLLP